MLQREDGLSGSCPPEHDRSAVPLEARHHSDLFVGQTDQFLVHILNDVDEHASCNRGGCQEGSDPLGELNGDRPS